MAKSIPELSLDTQTLERILAATSVGGVVPYETLSAAIGRDVQRDGRGCLRSARLRLRRSQRMVFGAVTNVGLKRLDDVGTISAMKGHALRGRNQYRQVLATASTVEFSALPNHLGVEHNVLVAQAGALLHMTSGRATRKLASAIGNASAAFKPGASLELMKSTL